MDSLKEEQDGICNNKFCSAAKNLDQKKNSSFEYDFQVVDEIISTEESARSQAGGKLLDSRKHFSTQQNANIKYNFKVIDEINVKNYSRLTYSSDHASKAQKTKVKSISNSDTTTKICSKNEQINNFQKLIAYESKTQTRDTLYESNFRSVDEINSKAQCGNNIYMFDSNFKVIDEVSSREENNDNLQTESDCIKKYSNVYRNIKYNKADVSRSDFKVIDEVSTKTEDSKTMDRINEHMRNSRANTYEMNKCSNDNSIQQTNLISVNDFKVIDEINLKDQDFKVINKQCKINKSKTQSDNLIILKTDFKVIDEVISNDEKSTELTYENERTKLSTYQKKHDIKTDFKTMQIKNEEVNQTQTCDQRNKTGFTDLERKAQKTDTLSETLFKIVDEIDSKDEDSVRLKDETRNKESAISEFKLKIIDDISPLDKKVSSKVHSHDKTNHNDHNSTKQQVKYKKIKALSSKRLVEQTYSKSFETTSRNLDSILTLRVIDKVHGDLRRSHDREKMHRRKSEYSSKHRTKCVNSKILNDCNDRKRRCSTSDKLVRQKQFEGCEEFTLKVVDETDSRDEVIEKLGIYNDPSKKKRSNDDCSISQQIATSTLSFKELETKSHHVKKEHDIKIHEKQKVKNDPTDSPLTSQKRDIFSYSNFKIIDQIHLNADVKAKDNNPNKTQRSNDKDLSKDKQIEMLEENYNCINDSRDCKQRQTVMRECDFRVVDEVDLKDDEIKRLRALINSKDDEIRKLKGLNCEKGKLIDNQKFIVQNNLETFESEPKIVDDQFAKEERINKARTSDYNWKSFETTEQNYVYFKVIDEIDL